jgi:hypothetical protein
VKSLDFQTVHSDPGLNTIPVTNTSANHRKITEKNRFDLEPGHFLEKGLVDEEVWTLVTSLKIIQYLPR